MTPPETAFGTDRLADSLRGLRAGGLLVVTGAGVSLASGIPTFRGSDPGAVWTRDVTERGTRRYFEEDPAGSWSWYLGRFDRALDAQPNPAHRALVELERWQTQRGGDFLLLTQNVDTLHEQAGSERLVKVHGSADRVRCSRPGCAQAAPRGWLLRSSLDLGPFRREPTLAQVPRCPACGALLRPHVLWFDESYDEHESYGLPRVAAAASDAALLLFVGTSFSVGITDFLVGAAGRRGTPAYAIDPGVPPALPGVSFRRGAAEDLLPALVAALG